MVKTQYDTNSDLLGSFFSNDVDSTLIIPHYQRGFSWKIDQVSDFINDLLEQFEKNTLTDQYFFGTITTIDKGVKNGSRIYELIDGQQRTTIVQILLACIRDIYFETNSTLKDEVQKEIFNVGIPAAQEEHYKLILDDDDDTFFRDNILKKMTKSKIDEIKKEPTPLETHLNLQKAYLQIREALALLLKNVTDQTEKEKILNNLRTTIRKSFVISILTVEKASKAYTLFNRMNDRGLKLEPADLAKDLILSQINDEVNQNTSTITKDDAIKKWKELERKTEKKKNPLNNFLHHYLVTFHSKKDNQKAIDESIRVMKQTATQEGWDQARIATEEANIMATTPSTVFHYHTNDQTFDDLEDIFKTKKMTGAELLVDLHTKFGNYMVLKKPNSNTHPNVTSNCKEILQTMNKLNVIIILPVLMAALEKYDKNDVEKLSELLVKWFFRTKTVGGASASTLEKELAGIAYEILINNMSFADVKDKLKNSNYNITDNLFVNTLKEITLVSHLARYVLTKIIEKQQLVKITDMSLGNKITLEHIMPNIGVEKPENVIDLDANNMPKLDAGGNPIMKKVIWMEYIMKENKIIDIRDAKSFHLKFRHRLGNLTLINKQKNSALGTQPFTTKCNAGKDKNGDERGCYDNSLINITKNITNFPVWNQDSIEKRQNDLADVAKDVWII